MTEKKLYRVRVQTEILATFEVRASNPSEAELNTLVNEPVSIQWITGGRVIAIEEKTPEGWKAASPDEAALVRAINAGVGEQ